VSRAALPPLEQNHTVRARLLLGLGLAMILATTGCDDPPKPPPPPSANTPQLVFTRQPESRVAGEAQPDLQVTFQDPSGNPLDEPGATVILRLASYPAGVDFRELQAPLERGVATFKGVSLTRAWSGYVFEARKGSTRRLSASFSVSPAAPTRLGLLSQPGEAAIDSPIAPPVQVTAEDAYGNPRSETPGEITASLVGGTGVTLAGTTRVPLVDGVATFGDLLVDTVGEYSLSFSAPGLAATESRRFRVGPGRPSALAFSAQPSNALAGQVVAPAITVTVLDRRGNVSATEGASVTLSLDANPGGATLTGTLTASTVAGVATFTGVRLDKAGAGYTLRATSGSLGAATSSTFDVSPGPPVRLAFSSLPLSGTAGEALAVAVSVVDVFGNTTPSTARISVALGANPGGDTLSGTLAVDAVEGVASFGTLSLRKAARGYTLVATAPELTGATSAAFAIVPAAPARLLFSVQPSDATAGASITPSVQVRLLDAFDNQTLSTDSVTMALEANPGSGRLLGNTTRAASAGVASFSTLAVNKAASGYTLRASSGALSATSAPFTITPGGAAALVFLTQPPSGTAGVPLSPAVRVQVQDAFGNTASGRVTLALDSNPGGATLGGTLSADTVAGVASFSNLTLQKAAAGYTLRASMAGTPGSISRRFDIQAAAAVRIGFILQPALSSALNTPLGPEPLLQAFDAFENVATSFNGPVSMALGNNPSGATLSGTLTVNAVSGLATFSNLRLDRVGTGYTLAATTPGLPETRSNPFNIAQARLVYTDPSAGRVRLLRNPASTDTQVVLDLVANEPLTGYGVGFNLLLDAGRVKLNSMAPGAVLSPGSNPVAARAALSTAAGPLQSILTSGQSQKAAGTGAVTTDMLIPAGSVLYTLRLDLTSGSPGLVFDGASLGASFQAALRDKLGNDVVRRTEFGIGRLEVLSP
jgi:hypothetical protein